MKAKKDPVDIKKLSKKYKLDVNKIISAWKKDKNDTEISAALNIDMLKLFQLRQDIEDVHMKERNTRRSLKERV